MQMGLIDGRDIFQMEKWSMLNSHYNYAKTNEY